MLCECFILYCCTAFAAKTGICAFTIQMNCTPDKTDSKMCFLLAALCKKKKEKKFSNYLLMYIFNFAIIPDLCKSKYSCCHLFVVYYYDFCPYLVAIKDTLIFERLWSCMCGTSSTLFPCGSLSQVVWLKGSSCHWFLLIKFKDLLMRIWSSTPLLSAIIHNPKNSTQSHLSSHVRLRLSCFSFDQSQ